MKKFVLSIIAIAGLSFAMAQANQVPYVIKSSFQQEHKNMVVEWTLVKQSQQMTYYVANWDENGQHKSRYYYVNENATEPNVSRTEVEVELTALSQPLQDVVNNNFLAENSQYQLKRSFKVEGMDGVVEGCEFTMSSGTQLFVFYDANGKLVKRELIK